MEVEKEGENIRYTHSVNLVHVLYVCKCTCLIKNPHAIEAVENKTKKSRSRK